MSLRKTMIVGVAALASTLASSSLAMASGINLVQNGDFEQTTNGANLQLKSGFTSLNNWTVDGGLSFVVSQGWTGTTIPGHSPDTGAWGQYGQFNVWSPNTGAANGFVDSPLGGNYIVADGAENYHAAIWQTINGLTPGAEYAVSFSWATGQQSGFDGPTWNKGWDVTFGGVTQYTTRVTDVEHGFTGWMSTTMTFTATGASQVLSFLAQGEPNGVPPLVMLDGVSVMQTVPEPSSVLMMGVGGAGVLAMGLRRRRASR